MIAIAGAESTRIWQQTKYDEFEKGTAHGVAINSDGSLSLAPSFNPLYTSASTYFWDIASDDDGNVYAAADIAGACVQDHTRWQSERYFRALGAASAGASD